MRPSSTAAKVAFGVVGTLLVAFNVPGTARDAGANGFAPISQEIARIVYVSATDKDGNAVTDLQQADFELKADGKKSAIVNVRPAQAPLRIALIVSDAGTGGFQLGLATFMQRLLGRAEFSLISLIVQPETVVDYSSEAGTLKAALLRLGPRGRQRGAQLMETIQAATKHVQRDGTRPVIVVTRVGAEATTPISGSDVREQLRQSGAILYVVSTAGAERGAPTQARPGISTEQAQLQDSEVADGAFNLAQVLGDGSKESGGRHDQVISTTLVPALERVANELLNQYAISYMLPDGARPGDKLTVSTKRKGVKVLAPSRIPL
jgi:VWFA-related protein